MKRIAQVLSAMAALTLISCQTPSSSERSANQVYDRASNLMEKRAEVSSAQTELHQACLDMSADGIQAEEREAYQEICEGFTITE